MKTNLLNLNLVHLINTIRMMRAETQRGNQQQIIMNSRK